MKVWIAGLAALLGFSPHAVAATRQGVDIIIQSVPVLARTGAGRMLRYELRLTNFNRSPLTLTRVEIIDPGTRSVIGTLSGKALNDGLRPIQGDKPEAAAILQPGRTNLLFIDLPVPSDARPAGLLHRLMLTDGTSGFQVEAASTPVRPVPPSDLGPPLEGGPWVAVHEPSMDGGHRRAPYATAGKATVPGRFAIDWFKVDEQGRRVAGTGAAVLSVADGLVVATRDDFADPAPGSGPLDRIDLDNDAGNYVTVRIADGRYAFYEHLKQGIRVKMGERVRRGQVLGFLGSTGHVLGPHLHFHVADANSPLGAEGIPYGFRSFELVGRYQSISEFFQGAAWKPASGIGSGLPEPNLVVRFPE